MNWYQELQLKKDADLKKEDEDTNIKERQDYNKVKEILKYICLVMGAARDYDYLIHQNKNVMDNEVTSIHPLTYPKISFILFILSLQDPYLHHLFSFTKSREYGVYSKSLNDVFDSIENKYNKSIRRGRTYSFANREFVYLKMPHSLSLTNVPTYTKKDDSWMYKLFIEGDTRMLRHPHYQPNRLKPKDMIELESIFKEDVLLYMPVFYHNYYLHLNTLKGLYISKTDRKKEVLKLGLSDDGKSRLLEKKRKFFESLGSVDKPQLKYKVQKEIDSEDELHEFFLKSILVRRNPNERINTRLNNTNGVYLLQRGVALFREAVLQDILSSRIIPDFSFIDIKERNIFIDKKVKSRDSVYDFNSKYLLKEDIHRIIQYKYKGLHRLLKYIQIYSHLVYSDNSCYYLLATIPSLREYTGWNGIRNKEKLHRTFRAFERIPTQNIKKLSRIFGNGYQI